MSPAARLVRYVLPPLLYAAAIFALSGMSKPPGPPLLYNLDKLAHFSEYLGLGLLTARALGAYARTGARALSLAVLLCALYAVSDEVHQLFVPGRSADLLDLLADVLGAGSGAALWLRWSRRTGVQPAGTRR